MSPVRVTRTGGGWEEFRARSKRATGRATVALGVGAASETKRVTHVIFGTLRRSVHAAPAGSPEGHEADLRDAESTEQGGAGLDLLLERGAPLPTYTPFGPVVEVGSWLPYACVEWVGRGHPGVTQGVEAIRGPYADAVVRRAFAEEGLA